MNKLKAAILGAGEMGEIHAQNLKKIEKVELTAITSLPLASAKKLKEDLGLKQIYCYDNFDKMLAERELDLLYVCLPPFAHQGEVEKAAAKGINIFIEKPIALNLKKAESMVSAVENAGVYSQVGFHFRLAKPVQKLKQLLENKTAGKVSLIQGHYFCNSLHSEWWRDIEKSGGQILEQIIHLYDLLLYLFGEIDYVDALMDNLCHQEVDDYTIEDSSISLLKFKSGAIGSIAGSNCAVPGKWEKSLTVICENLSVEFDNIVDAVFNYTKKDTVEEEKITTEKDLYYAESRNFVDSILKNKTTITPIRDGLKAMVLIDKIIESAKKSDPK